MILHAGDFMALPVLTQLRAIGEVRGVYGNMDDAQLRAMLPASTVVELPGATCWVPDGWRGETDPHGTLVLRR